MMSYIVLGLLALSVYLATKIIARNKLSQFNGPFLASFTDLWLVWYLYFRSQEEPFVELHKRYGKIVRVGPNRLRFSTTASIRDIYSVSNNLSKSNYYPVMSPTAEGYQFDTFFSSNDLQYHDNIKRIVQKYFTIDFTRAYDTVVDENVKTLVHQLRTRFADKKGDESVFDLALWSNYFTLDAISQIAYGKPYGYMKNGSDVINLIRDNRFFFFYSYYVGYAPWIDRLLLKNPILLWLNRHGAAKFNSWAADHALRCHLTRERELSDGDPWSNTMLDHFISDKVKYPNVINDQEVVKLVLSIVFAGADTSATLIGAVFRYVMLNPHVYATLQTEIDSVDSVAYPNVERIPYLDAVIKESARMCPIVRFASERVVPTRGMIIDGVKVPGSTDVAVSQWAYHRDASVWGDNPDQFSPERWLDPAKNKAMSSKLLHFGTGKFQCTGMHIANRETYKAIHGVFKHFHLELKEDWKWSHSTLTSLESMQVRITSR